MDGGRHRPALTRLSVHGNKTFASQRQDVQNQSAKFIPDKIISFE
jgi:hypothetical protein